MSEIVIINIILGTGYFLQAVIAFGILWQYHLASPNQYIAMMTKKGLMAELMLVVAIISTTVALQNLVELGDACDGMLFVWRIVFNIWSISIWVRWFNFNRFVLKALAKNE